jgi:citrate synthase
MDYDNMIKNNMPLISRLAEQAGKSTQIDTLLYNKYDVKRGLRDLDGRGVLAGLTEISEINAYSKEEDGSLIRKPGELYYRGIPIEEIVDGFVQEGRFGFEEVIYLLLFGKLPNMEEYKEFCSLLFSFRSLPPNFVRDIIMKKPSIDMMNVLARSVLTLYAYDEQADDISLPNVLRQCLQLISQLPLISVYGYQVYKHYHDGGSLIIHNSDKNLSMAENILHLLRHDSKFTHLEAKLLDICFVLHAEHGGGNNSTFTTHVVSSSGTDTYSTVAASLGSLKGPRHGGANVKVIRMMEDLKSSIRTRSESEVRDYLVRILKKEAFDRKGLIYGIGHAIYSVSDPRALILENYVRDLAEEKGLSEEYELYLMVKKIAPEIIAERSRMYKGVSANIDFFSGLVYKMLGLPIELFTPMFAVSRMAGWSAHRIEELSNNGKIIRPAYMAVAERQSYKKLSER